MEREALTELAIRVAGSFPAVTRGRPFGEGTEVFKVVGKVFALVNLGDRPACLTLKCAPPHARSLVASYDSIIPGYHVNKQHWISIVASGPAHPAAARVRAPDVDETLVEDLIGNSYDIVVSLLPRDRRPVDPSADERSKPQ